MPLNKVLQNPEESVRRPKSLDDTVLLNEVDNAVRQAVAELDPVHIGETLNAIVSQIRETLFGSDPANWSDVPPINLIDLIDLPDIIEKTITILPGVTLAVDTIPFVDFKSVKYIVEITNPAADLVGTFELSANKQGSDVSDSISSIVGHRFASPTQFQVSGADSVFEVTNNETFALTVKLTKL